MDPSFSKFACAHEGSCGRYASYERRVKTTYAVWNLKRHLGFLERGVKFLK